VPNTKCGSPAHLRTNSGTIDSAEGDNSTRLPSHLRHSSRSGHKLFLFRRIGWRMQANAWGFRNVRAVALWRFAKDADLRIRAPKNFLKEDLDEARTLETSVAPTQDPRLPIRCTRTSCYPSPSTLSVAVSQGRVLAGIEYIAQVRSRDRLDCGKAESKASRG
jgi:hypothetical protein